MLYTLGYEDQGRVRPILYRASMAEMIVPYGDPAPTHYRKNVLDEGEHGLGMLANSLRLGCDCLGYIHYFDAVMSNGRGEAVTLPNAVCMHEEDYGVLWKHTDWRTNEVETPTTGHRIVHRVQDRLVVPVILLVVAEGEVQSRPTCAAIGRSPVTVATNPSGRAPAPTPRPSRERSRPSRRGTAPAVAATRDRGEDGGPRSMPMHGFQTTPSPARA